MFHLDREHAEGVMMRRRSPIDCWRDSQEQTLLHLLMEGRMSQKKGTNAATVAVPFQKATNIYHSDNNFYTLGYKSVHLRY